MTLEDFFTLTEMKDGLTALSRVEELVNVMQKEKDCVVNTGDAIRQWAAVASIIATTENKDCLDLFVQLGGLCFIDQWLKDAEELGANAGDSFVEESVTALLGALEKLCVDKERSIPSGIWVTLKNLHGHSSLRVKDRVREVFENLKLGNKDTISSEVENADSVNDGTPGDVNLDRGSSELECSVEGLKHHAVNIASELIRTENTPPQSSNGIQPEKTEDVQTENKDNGLQSNMDSEGKSSLDLPASSVVLNDFQERASDEKNCKDCTVEDIATGEACNHAFPPVKGFGKADTLPENDIDGDGRKVEKCSGCEENLSATEASTATDAVKRADFSSNADASTREITAVSSVGTEVDANEGNLCIEAAALLDLRTPVHNSKFEKADVGAHKPKTAQDSDCSSNATEISSGNKLVSGMNEIGGAGKGKKPVRDAYRDFGSVSILQTLGMNEKKSSKLNDGGKSIIGLEYGIVDALEVARQVAQEVEREMTDSREPFCSSSSGRISGDDVNEKPDSPDSIERLAMQASPEEMSTGESKSVEAEPEGDGSVTKSDDLDIEPKSQAQQIESSHVTESSHQQEVKTEKGFCEFDLNEEVCSDDLDCKDSVRDDIVSSGGRNDDLTQQRHKCLEFDLNMAEGGEDAYADPVPDRQILVSSSVNSKDSSAEVNPGRSEKLELDLNSAGEENDDVVVLGMRIDRQIVGHHNGHSCPSPSSSSSQFQPAQRNFDLNDRPYSYNDPPDQVPYQNASPHSTITFGRPKPDPFISIMGTRVEVSKEAPHVSSYHSNGKAHEPAGVFGIGSAVSSLYSPLTRCGILPAGHTISFSPPPYCPSESVPCMVDPRVNPYMPGSASPAPLVLPSYSMPFMMGLSAGPSRPQLDLNSGFSENGGSREPGFFRQFFPPSQVRPTDEHPGTFLQPFPGPMIGTKRKEPEGGWDLYPITYGQQQSPWK